MSRDKLVQSLDFYELEIPSIASGGLDPVAAIARIRDYLTSETDPRDHELLNWRFDAILGELEGEEAAG